MYPNRPLPRRTRAVERRLSLWTLSTRHRPRSPRSQHRQHDARSAPRFATRRRRPHRYRLLYRYQSSARPLPTARHRGRHCLDAVGRRYRWSHQARWPLEAQGARAHGHRPRAPLIAPGRLRTVSDSWTLTVACMKVGVHATDPVSSVTVYSMLGAQLPAGTRDSIRITYVYHMCVILCDAACACNVSLLPLVQKARHRCVSQPCGYDLRLKAHVDRRGAAASTGQKPAQSATRWQRLRQALPQAA